MWDVSEIIRLGYVVCCAHVLLFWESVQSFNQLARRRHMLILKIFFLFYFWTFFFNLFPSISPPFSLSLSKQCVPGGCDGGFETFGGKSSTSWHCVAAQMWEVSELGDRGSQHDWQTAHRGMPCKYTSAHRPNTPIASYILPGSKVKGLWHLLALANAVECYRNSILLF